MVDDVPTILNHVSVGTDDVERAGRFYDAVLTPLGAQRLHAAEWGLAYGKKWPEFWVQLAFDQGRASGGNGTHIAFMAPPRDAVDAFYQAGLDQGGQDAGVPGERDYTPGYYASFLHDPDGNKIEAVHMPLGE